MNVIVSWDRALFYWINHGWARPSLDPFFVFWTEPRFFVAPGIGAVIWLLWKGGDKGRRVLLALLLGVLLTDQMASHVVKPVVHRLRPCVALTDARTPHGKTTSLSFPSSHATNIAGAMTILALAYTGAWRCLFVAVALLVGLSRVYLGVHYPGDVLGGFVLGIFLGSMAWKVTGRYMIERSTPPENNACVGDAAGNDGNDDR